MKKTFLVLGIAAVMAVFTACGNSGATNKENTEEKAAVENADEEVQKCGEGKCGEGKCGGATEDGAKQDHFSSIDTDGDGQITQEEFVAHITKEFSEKDANGDGKITADECGHFDQLNTDGDDFISDQEFTDGHDAMFKKMDADGSGTISREEMEAQMKKMEADKAEVESKCGEGKCGK
jgi:Ca2+-binding EF-hand superfamily protein